MNKFSDLGIKAAESKKLVGDKIKIDKILNKEIIVLGYRIDASKYEGKCLCLQISLSDTKRVVFTGSKKLLELVQQTHAESFPFTTAIVKEDDDSLNFT